MGLRRNKDRGKVTMLHMKGTSNYRTLEISWVKRFKPRGPKCINDNHNFKYLPEK
jgi:hypothetical protein